MCFGCGVISLFAGRTFADDEPLASAGSNPGQRIPRADRIVTLQFIEPELEVTSPSLKGPEL